MGYVHVGKVLSSQGIRGEVFIYIFAQEAAWFENWQCLYLSKEEEESPSQKFEIQSKRAHSKQKKPGFVLRLKQVNDRNSAEALRGLKVYIPEEFLVSGDDEEIYLREVLDFEVKDVERGSVGKVVGFSGNFMQDLLVIADDQGREFEVPFTEPILIEIKRDEQTIVMDIPFGLLPDEEI